MMLIRKKASHPIKSSEITPETIYRDRRKFIQGGAGLAAGSLLGQAYAAYNWDLSNLPDSRYNTEEELTSYKKVTTYNNFYELSSSKDRPAELAHHLITKPWSITVAGACENPGTYQLEDFISPYQLEDRIYRLRCVEAWSMVIPWVGFEISKVIERAKPTSGAQYVAFTSIYDPDNLPGQKRRTLDWPYREGLRMDEAMNPLAIFAVGLYGEVLPNQNGAPLRLVVPWKYGFKSIKSIVRMEFTAQQPTTTWGRSAPSEYGFYSNVNPNVNHPRWSQKRERRIGEFRKRETLMFNGYEEDVGHLYAGMDLKVNY